MEGEKPPLPSAHNCLTLSPPELLCLKDKSPKMAAQAALTSVAACSNPVDKQQPFQLKH